MDKTEADKKRIKKANEHILGKMKRGESLATVSTEATWYPPRPRIEKDLSKLYTNKSSLHLVGDDDETTTC